MTNPRLLVAVLLVAGSASSATRLGAVSPAPPRIRAADRVRLAEAFAVIGAVQEKAWPGWDAAPSGLVLVDRAFEYLLRFPGEPEGFAASEDDPALGGTVRVRPRTFSPRFLATFPAFGPAPTIVVGTAEGTGKRSTAWACSSTRTARAGGSATCARSSTSKRTVRLAGPGRARKPAADPGARVHGAGRGSPPSTERAAPQ